MEVTWVFLASYYSSSIENTSVDRRSATRSVHTFVGWTIEILKYW